jgi:hypothetical protein
LAYDLEKVQGKYEFMILYLATEDVYFIVPASALEGRRTANISKDHLSNGKGTSYGQFREAWHLLETERE